MNTLDDLFENQHLQAIGFFHHATHPSEGATVLPKPTVQFSATPVSIHCHAPRYGEHGAEVLKELWYTQNEIEGLEECGALGGALVWSNSQIMTFTPRRKTHVEDVDRGDG